jgi:hypothetical protein
MNATYAVVSDGVVVNMIIIDTSAAPGQAGDYVGQLVPAKDNAGIGWSWDGKKFTPPLVPEPTQAEQIAIAEQYKAGLLQTANKITADWRTELVLGIISDDDKAKLILWMQYIKAVKAVDVSTAPDIDWPEEPQ